MSDQVRYLCRARGCRCKTANAGKLCNHHLHLANGQPQEPANPYYREPSVVRRGRGLRVKRQAYW